MGRMGSSKRYARPGPRRSPTPRPVSAGSKRAKTSGRSPALDRAPDRAARFPLPHRRARRHAPALERAARLGPPMMVHGRTRCAEAEAVAETETEAEAVAETE